MRPALQSPSFRIPARRNSSAVGTSTTCRRLLSSSWRNSTGDSNIGLAFTKREVMPGNLRGAALEDFIRDEASTYHHQTCTAKMGRDSMSVVDGQLKVYGIENLRVADGSTMPRVTTGNTMAPCIIIGERAAEILREEHRLKAEL